MRETTITLQSAEIELACSEYVARSLATNLQTGMAEIIPRPGGAPYCKVRVIHGGCRTGKCIAEPPKAAPVHPAICHKCLHHRPFSASTEPGGSVWEHQCKTRPGVMDHVTGDSSPALCYAFNKGGNCRLFEEKLKEGK